MVAQQNVVALFDVISVSVKCLGAISCDINTIGGVSVSDQWACRVRWLPLLCNSSLGDDTVHEQKGTTHVKRRNYCD